MSIQREYTFDKNSFYATYRIRCYHGYRSNPLRQVLANPSYAIQEYQLAGVLLAFDLLETLRYFVERSRISGVRPVSLLLYFDGDLLFSRGSDEPSNVWVPPANRVAERYLCRSSHRLIVRRTPSPLTFHENVSELQWATLRLEVVLESSQRWMWRVIQSELCEESSKGWHVEKGKCHQLTPYCIFIP